MNRLILLFLVTTILAVLVIELGVSGRHHQVSIEPEPLMPGPPILPDDEPVTEEVRS
jgi:hypothetical protein